MKSPKRALYSLALCLSAFLSVPALELAIDFYVINFETPGIKTGYSAQVYYSHIFRVSAIYIGSLSFIVFLISSLAYLSSKLEAAGQAKNIALKEPKPRLP